MSQFFHPYVAELSIIPLKSAKSAAVRQQPEEKLQNIQENVEENVEYIAEVDDAPDEEASELIDSETFPEHNIEFVMNSQDDEFEDNEELDSPVVEDEIYNDMHLEPEAIKSIKSSYEHDYSTSHVDNIYISEVQEYDEGEPEIEEKKRIGSANILLIILTVLLLGAVLALCYFVFLRPYMMGIDTAEYMREIFGAASSTPLI